MPDPYETATYYDAEDAEAYVHETPESAIEAYLDMYMTPGCDAAKVIAECGQITVLAHRRRDVTDGWVRNQARALTESLIEAWGEEFGNTDGSTFDEFTDAQVTKAEEDLVPWIRETIGHAVVWQCEKVAERTYSADEVLAMMRVSRPEWFEKEGGNK